MSDRAEKGSLTERPGLSVMAGDDQAGRSVPRSQPPGGRRYGARREEIMTAAVRLFNARGLKGATLVDIAAEVGLAANSITYYFRKKEDIVTACLLQTIDVYTEIVSQVTKDSDKLSAAEKVSRFFVAFGQMLAEVDAGERPPIVQFHDIQALTGPHAKRVFAAYIEMSRQIRTLLHDDSTAGWSRVDSNARTLMLMSAVMWMRSWIRRYDRSQYLIVGERFANVVLNGIGTRDARWAVSGPEAAWHLVDEMPGSSEAFLRAATELVNEQGYRGASIDRIAARINLTKGSFYHHHETKHDLVIECFTRTFAVLRRAFTLADTTEGSGWDRACMVTRALLRFQLSDKGPLLRFSAFSALPDRALRDEVRLDMLRVVERMNSLLVAGMIDGSIRPLDPAVGAQVIVGMLNATLELNQWVPDMSEGEIAELFGRTMIFGLLDGPPTTQNRAPV